MSDLGTIFLLSLLAMFNPTLVAAVTLMLLLPNPKRLMFGYLLGAYTASISVGLVIVFALPNSGATSTSKNTLSPAEDIVAVAVKLFLVVMLRQYKWEIPPQDLTLSNELFPLPKSGLSLKLEPYVAGASGNLSRPTEQAKVSS